MIRILTLMENRMGEHKGLTAEHGLSFLIEGDGKRILFDCGSGENTLKNAVKLNVDPVSVDILAFSHSHYDHAAGFLSLAEQGLRAETYIGEGFFQEKYADCGQGKYTYLGCGFSEAYLRDHVSSLTVNRGTVRLTDHCVLETSFPRVHAFEQVPSRFVKWDGKEMAQDLFEDEQCLVLDLGKEIAVVVGCSHPGILNMLSEVSRRWQKPICAVLGGTHLVEADEERTRQTIREMKAMGIRNLGLNHCSGAQAEEWIDQDETVIHTHLSVGACMFME